LVQYRANFISEYWLHKFLWIIINELFLYCILESHPSTVTLTFPVDLTFNNPWIFTHSCPLSQCGNTNNTLFSPILSSQWPVPLFVKLLLPQYSDICQEIFLFLFNYAFQNLQLHHFDFFICYILYFLNGHF